MDSDPEYAVNEYFTLYDTEYLKAREALRSLHAYCDDKGLRLWQCVVSSRETIYEEDYREALRIISLADPDTDTDCHAQLFLKVNEATCRDKLFPSHENSAPLTLLLQNDKIPERIKVIALIERGIILYNHKQYKQAATDWSDVISNESSTLAQRTRCRIRLARCYYALGILLIGKSTFQKVLEDDQVPEWYAHVARLEHAKSHFLYDDLEQANHLCQELLSSNAQPYIKSVAESLVGRICMRKNNYESACTHFSKATEYPYVQKSTIIEALTLHAWIMYATDSNDRAETLIRQAESHSPTDRDQISSINVLRALLLADQGNLPDAKKLYDEIIADKYTSESLRDFAADSRKNMLVRHTDDGEEIRGPDDSRLTDLVDPSTRGLLEAAMATGQKIKTDFFSESLFNADSSILLTLRRWNSFTPALPRDGDPARGGGYFIRHAGMGIVVDPGFDFLELFAQFGGRLIDIDCIVVTHAHNDHTADLENILMLVYERNTRYGDTGSEKKVKLLLSHGVARKFSGLLELRKSKRIAEIIVLNRHTSDNVHKLKLSDHIELTVLPAYHDDIITEEYSIGLAFSFICSRDSDVIRTVLFTGDTAILGDRASDDLSFIHEKYPSPFSVPGHCNLVIAHIGTVTMMEIGGRTDVLLPDSDRRSVPYYDKHLGLLGTYRLLYDLRPESAIISEFGEEMRDIWIKTVQTIGNGLRHSLKQAMPIAPCVFAGDPVIVYNIEESMFLCHKDLKYHPPHELTINRACRGGTNLRSSDHAPYLFLSSKDGLDIADYEASIRRFHVALRDRKDLPFFIQSL